MRGNLLKIALMAERYSQRPSDLLFPDDHPRLKLAIDNLCFDLQDEELLRIAKKREQANTSQNSIQSALRRR